MIKTKVIVSETRGNIVVLVIDDKIQYEELQDNEIIVELGNYNDYLKPIWDGAKWIENATQEELDELNNQPKLLTLEERINSVENTILQILFM